MAYSILGSTVHPQAIAETSTTAKNPLGRIVQAVDPTYGVAEFMYLLGVASTVVGSIVNYDGVGYQTALDTAAVTGPSRPLAIAMSANGAAAYGWYQISGVAIASKANTVSFADGAGLGSASGLAVAVVTGTVLQGAVVAAVSSAKSDVTTVRVFINRPHGPSDVS